MPNVPLDRFMRLSDRFQKYSAPIENSGRVCFGCDEVSDKHLKCSGCSFFWFCSKVSNHLLYYPEFTTKEVVKDSQIFPPYRTA